MSGEGASLIPDDVRDLAERAAGLWFRAIGKDSYHFADAIALAIVADRRNCADAILAKRYTEDQGIDAEMDAFNGGLEDAAKLLRGEA
jgi:hypothetical protein